MLVCFRARACAFTPSPFATLSSGGPQIHGIRFGQHVVKLEHMARRSPSQCICQCTRSLLLLCQGACAHDLPCTHCHWQDGIPYDGVYIVSVKKVFKEEIYGTALPVQSARRRARACRHAHIRDRGRARTLVCLHVRTASIRAQRLFAGTLVKTGSRSTTTRRVPARRLPRGLLQRLVPQHTPRHTHARRRARGGASGSPPRSV